MIPRWGQRGNYPLPPVHGGANLASNARMRDNHPMASGALNVRFEAVTPAGWCNFAAGCVERFHFPTWLERAEQARTAFGSRAETSHVPEGEWMEQWRAGVDPASAVIERLD
jgi:hypothetical protein